MTVGSRVNARFEHIFLAFENYCVKTKKQIQTDQYYSSLHVVLGL